MRILAVVPARHGSKGIPRKNLRLLNGKPLIGYVLETLKNTTRALDIVVSSDSNEIIDVVKKTQVYSVKRPEELSKDNVTLDPVVNHAVNYLEKKIDCTYDIVITVQPTSPLLSHETLNNALNYFLKSGYDSLLSAKNEPHLSWTLEKGGYTPNYKERLNRQSLPANFKETGAFLITWRKYVNVNSRLGHNVSIFEVPKTETIDIDSEHDWWIAEKEINKQYIVFRVDGNRYIGLGHIYRLLLLAYNLIDHDFKFVLSKNSVLGIEKIKDSFFDYEVIENNDQFISLMYDEKPDVIINDILDTDEHYIQKLRNVGARIVNFEDLGTGAQYADAVINDLYEKKNDLPNHYWGSKYYCLRDQFFLAVPTQFNEKVNNVLILFGGTDPSNLTEKVLLAVLDSDNLKHTKFTFVLGMGYENINQLKKYVPEDNTNIKIYQNVSDMPSMMEKADVAISSQGRTIYELAHMKVPAILMAQNERELKHNFGYLQNGFINLGLGSKVDKQTITQTLTWLIETPQIRRQMRSKMAESNFKNGVNRVKNIILGGSSYE